MLALYWDVRLRQRFFLNIWEATLAAFIGASNQADAFYMTTSIFGILYPILDLGIWKAFLPIYKTKLVEKNYSRLNKLQILQYL